MRSRFRKELSPQPETFYQDVLGKLSRPNHKGWVTCRCPFHKSKSGKSFSVNLESGGFHCFGCDAKGGDIIAFVMLRVHCDFKTAAKQLGAWDDGGKVPARRPGPLVRYLVLDVIIDGVEYRAEVLDEPRTEFQQLRRFHAEASDRLSEIRRGDAEKFEGEEQAQWNILADSWELIQMEVPSGQR